MTHQCIKAHQHDWKFGSEHIAAAAQDLDLLPTHHFQRTTSTQWMAGETSARTRVIFCRECRAPKSLEIRFSVRRQFVGMVTLDFEAKTITGHRHFEPNRRLWTLAAPTR